VSYAQGLAGAGGLPLVGVDHFLGHIYSCCLDHPELLEEESRYPVMALVVSGGHTSLVRIDSDGQATMVGQTLDDAAGEAFDKAAKILGLGYPGGPIIDRLARDGNPAAYDFPRALTGGTGKPVREEDRFNFSFSGLKTALLYQAEGHPPTEQDLPDVAASYQEAIVDVLVRKTLAAADHCRAATILLCGGVACNRALRNSMADAVENTERHLIIADGRYCTDNAAMIAGIGYHYVRNGQASDLGIDVHARVSSDFGRLPFTPRAPGRMSREFGESNEPEE
jgi:N6-L-threonylcarbamoyladenine synthase